MFLGLLRKYNKRNSKIYFQKAELSYTTDSGENNTAVEKISNGDTTVLSTSISYDKDKKTYNKSYAGKEYSFKNTYDDNGYIVSDGINSYEYDKYGELIKTTGRHNSSYTYDERGNILTKTVDGETTSFAYDSPWKDQLTAVNDKAITYDANGNMLTYGDVQYSWTHGKMLSEITDGENTYEYKYDTNGIRSEKVKNGKRTIINTLNGTVISQNDIDSKTTMYFQYTAGTPLGFLLNDVQYLYITNPSGDVVGITDLDGNVLAEYSYDEWGKLLEITADNAENKALAELNPLRYRGYYYDSETGMYYLQSRYYSPELCRFISADDFSYITSSGKFAINAYAYCANNPIVFSDPTGYAYVSEAGKAIAELIGVLFVTLSAQKSLGDDFACFIASIFTVNPQILYFDRDEFSEWYKEVTDEFIEFMDSTIYKIIKLTCKDFFFQYFDRVVVSNSLYTSIEILGYLTVSLGFGNANGFMSSISDLLDGHFPIVNYDNVSSGLIIKQSATGIYIEQTYSIKESLFANLTLNLEADNNNFHLPPAPALAPNTVNDDMMYAIICGLIIFGGAKALEILGGLGALGGLGGLAGLGALLLA